MTQQKATLVLQTTTQDLTQSILQGVEDKLNNFKIHFQPKEPTIWVSRQDIADFLSISIVTVDDWTKKGILSAYRIGNKKRFKRNEVENALTKISK
ncbi:helix-turn-helix domain-containing protein [Tenacibaculum dicentrarchi]|nr:helix-turn-helix domain-containing protein [Tenacibaculum dicentrarchi]MCG8826991.1 helix-turn-helix domain-containing protein [Tenacibaculum dicentrarchi]